VGLGFVVIGSLFWWRRYGDMVGFLDLRASEGSGGDVGEVESRKERTKTGGTV
jgi:hypothetical protein